MNSVEQTNTMRRVLQVVLPMAFTLSLLISYSSFLQSMDLSCISQFINRKAMFLFCNAILLFVLRDSGLLAPSASSGVRPPRTDSVVCRNLVQNTSQLIFVSSPVALSSGPIGPTPCKVEEKNKVGVTVVEPLELGAVEEEGEEEVSEELEEVGGGVDQGVSEQELFGVEELNRRCEEFIEKVKRERQNEAKQLGIMV